MKTEWNPLGIFLMLVFAAQTMLAVLKFAGVINKWAVALCPVWFLAGAVVYNLVVNGLESLLIRLLENR